LQVIDRDNGGRIPFDKATTKSTADGLLAYAFSFDSNVPAGSYAANIATAAVGGTILATTNFTLTGATGAKPGPNVVVTPPQGQAGNRFVITGTGFAPKTTYSARIQTENRQLTVINPTDVTTDADGVLLVPFTPPATATPGVYIVEIISKGEKPQIITGARFTVTAAGARAPSPSPQPTIVPSAPTASDRALLGQSAVLISAIPDARAVVDSIAAQGIAQSFIKLDGAWGAYSASRKLIVYNTDLRGYDPHDLAAVMGHEGQHAADYAASGPVQGTQDCYNREARGFITEASLWKVWYGAGGKPGPTNDFEREMNAILNLLQNDPQRFAAILVDAYQGECEALLAIMADDRTTGAGVPASLAGMSPALVGTLPSAEAVFASLAVAPHTGDTSRPELPGGALTIR
jgi:hypothetical protein